MPTLTSTTHCADPITYAFQSILPPHFYCDLSAPQLCPLISTPTGQLIPLWGYVSSKYGFAQSVQFNWPYVGYLFLFAVVFQLAYITANQFLRFIVR